MRLILRRLGFFAGATLLMAFATWLIAWWTVPVIVIAWAIVERTDRWIPMTAAVAGALSWWLLLRLLSGGGGVERIAEAVGGVMGIGPRPLMALTLVFPALLAASAAGVVKSLLTPIRGPAKAA